MKKSKQRLSMLAWGLISAGLIQPVMAATVHEAKLPWHARDLYASSSGGDWSNVVKVYTTDINGDKNTDIIRLEGAEGANAFTVLTSNNPIPGQSNSSAAYYSDQAYFDDPSLYIGNRAPIPLSFNNHMNGWAVNLFFGHFDEHLGTDMIRQESTAHYAHDNFFSAQLMGNFKDTGNGNDFCSQTELHFGFNGYIGAEIHVGDFNNDGFDDVLRAETGSWSGDNNDEVNIHYGGTGSRAAAGMYNCDSGETKLGLTKAPNEFVIDPSSQGTDANLNHIFDMVHADVMIGDFNADGFDDIFRFDTDDRIGQLVNNNNHVAADIWFGLDNKEGRMKRSFIYDDSDGDWLFSSTDERLDDFKTQTSTKKRIGDFNGDGADDILTYSENDIQILLSRAVKADKNPADNTKVIFDKRRLGLFKKVVLDNVLDFNLDAAGVDVKIADFNQDGRDDVLVYNNQPYILYSQIPDSKANGGAPLALTAIKHTTTLRLLKEYNDGFSANKIGTKRLIEVADFTADGYPDILYVPTNKANAVLLATPPYNPLDEIKARHSGTVTQMQSVSQKSRNFVFFNDNGTLKYMARNELGWQTAKNVPLYLNSGNARCNNDLPVDGLHLDPSQFEQSQPSYQSGKEYFTKPECNASYNGEAFDVIADNQYIYLFRAKGERVLLDRFVYTSENNNLQRLIESRYKISGQRYKVPAGVVVGTDPTKSNSTGSSAAISIQDSFDERFFEPAFEVPFTSQKVNGQYCSIGALTASLMADKIAGHRFVLGTSCSNGGTLKLATIRKGESEPFNVKDFSFKDDNGVTVNVPGVSQYVDSIAYYPITNLDSLTYATKVNATQVGTNKIIEESLDIELILAVNMNENGAIGLRSRHIPMTQFGGFSDNSTPRKPYQGFPATNANKMTSPARVHFSNDGFVHMYWRGNNSSFSQNHQLFEAVLDPHLTLENNNLYANWNITAAQATEIEKLSWPEVTNGYKNLFAPANPTFDTFNPQLFKPAFGTYYYLYDEPLGSNFLTPLVFEYGVLVDNFNAKDGILQRTFVDALNINGNRQFAFSRQNMFKLKAEYGGRISTDLEMIGYIEGAPPVPKENMGRDQNGKWGYSAAASEISLAFDSSTKVGSTGDDSGGFQVNAEYGLGADIFATKIYGYVNASLAFAANSGTTEELSLEQTLTRKAFITGVPPAAECTGIQTPYQDACYKTETDGSKTELWHPHNEGSIFATSLQVDSYALRHPVTKALIGYQLDFQNAINTQQSINFNINPEYQVAGSLDGFIGNEQVRSITTASPYKSYFKPNQERQWLDKDERQKQELLQRYEQAKSTTSGTSASGFVNDQLLIAKTAISDGACLIQESRSAASITDYYGHSVDVSVNAGYEYSQTVGKTIKAQVGGFYQRQFKQEKENSESITFTPNLSCDIASEVQGPDNKTLPWAVNAYTVRSYFLPASLNNYTNLYEKIIHPTNPGDQTSALKQVLANAEQSPRKIWRITHRVDAVSRAMQNPFGG